MAKEKRKKRKGIKIVFTVLLCIVAFCVIAAIVGLNRASKGGKEYLYTDEVIKLSDDTIGDVEVSTVPIKNGTKLQRGSYTFSGRVIYSAREENGISYYTCNDDGTDIIRLCTVDENGGNRLLLFKDNRRVLLGDYVLECPEGQTLDNCEEGKAKLIPIEFPEEFSSDSAVVDEWTEVIIAPDCKHFAWTIRRSDCGAVNAMGELARGKDSYTIENPEYISNMNSFEKNGDYLTYTPEIGGEVKQFVNGGKGISLVGSAPCGMGDSIVQDVATGEVTQITKTPGYDETTIFSPDEKLGIVMTSRFSEKSDLGVMGLVDRPYGQPLHNIMGQVYMYSVTGVRGEREGNIGPALIDIEKSMEDEEYTGINLSDPKEEWVYNSPMSWNNDGTKAMWMERDRDGNHVRLRIVKLKDYNPDREVETVETPEVGDYAAAPKENMDYSGKIQGKKSGYVEVEKKSGFMSKATVTVKYHDYSDDGKYFYNGTETSSGSIMSKTTYTSDVKVTDKSGKEVGSMDVDMKFSAAYKLTSAFSGSTSPQLDVSGSEAVATWKGRTADISQNVK